MVVAHQGINRAPVTTSIGIAALPEHGTTATTLVAAADKALYRAKSDGRNRACVAEDGCVMPPSGDPLPAIPDA